MTTEFKTNSSDAVRQPPASLNLSTIHGAKETFPGSTKTGEDVVVSLFLSKHRAFLENQKKLEAENKPTLKLVTEETLTERKAYAFTG